MFKFYLQLFHELLHGQRNLISQIAEINQKILQDAYHLHIFFLIIASLYIMN